MIAQLLDSESFALKQGLQEFEREMPLRTDAQAKLAFLSEFLMKYVNASPRLRLALAQNLYQKNTTDLFPDPIARQRAAIRLLLAVASSKAQLSRQDDALATLQQVISQAEELGDLNALAEAQNLCGDIAMRHGKIGEAVAHFESALSNFQKLNLPYSIASVLNNLGILYVNLSEHSTALGYYKQASALLESEKDEKKLAPLYNNIGQAYFLMNQPDDALTYYEKSLALCDPSTMQRGVAMLYGNIGAVYEKKQMLQEALAYQQKSLRIKEEIEDKVGTAVSHQHIGRICLDQHQVDVAIQSFKTSLAIAESAQHDETTAQALILLAQALAKQNESAQAESPIAEWLFRALALAEKISSRRLQQEAHALLAQRFESVGDFRNAFYHFKKHHDIKAAIFNEESDKRVKNLQVAFKVEEAKKQAEIERLKNIELANALAEAETQRQIAEEASRVKSEVLNVVAHDLQTPISSVINFAYLLKQSPSLSEKQLEMLSRIEQVSQAILRQTVNLLNAASEKASADFRRETVHLYPMLKSVIDESGAIRKNQSVELDLNEETRIEGDSEKLREAFENLVSNAVKYSPRGKTIAVKGRTSDALDAVVISIKDEGQGMSDDDKAKLFGKFQRLSAKPTGGESSTGLGLYIAKQIIEKHGGKIWAESEGLGKGATFFVELPLQK